MPAVFICYELIWDLIYLRFKIYDLKYMHKLKLFVPANIPRNYHKDLTQSALGTKQQQEPVASIFIDFATALQFFKNLIPL